VVISGHLRNEHYRPAKRLHQIAYTCMSEAWRTRPHEWRSLPLYVGSSFASLIPDGCCNTRSVKRVVCRLLLYV
jgi:hypothetical protein